MRVSLCDVVTIDITDVKDYACWGIVEGQIGFVHISEWGWERPILPIDFPIVGQSLTVKVFHLVDEPQAQLPLDITFGGTIHVDFAASVRLLRPEIGTATI